MPSVENEGSSIRGLSADHTYFGKGIKKSRLQQYIRRFQSQCALCDRNFKKTPYHFYWTCSPELPSYNTSRREN